jgi:hypothetical protein
MHAAALVHLRQADGGQSDDPRGLVRREAADAQALIDGIAAQIFTDEELERLQIDRLKESLHMRRNDVAGGNDVVGRGGPLVPVVDDRTGQKLQQHRMAGRRVDRAKRPHQAALVDAVVNLVFAVIERPGAAREQNRRLILAEHIAGDEPLGEQLRLPVLGSALHLPEISRQLLHLLRREQTAFGQEVPKVGNRNAHAWLLWVVANVAAAARSSLPGPYSQAVASSLMRERAP